MEGEITLKADDSISIHFDHYRQGDPHPVTVFLNCEKKNRVGIGINVKGVKYRDDVMIDIDNGETVKMTCKQYDGSVSTTNCFVEKPKEEA